MNGTRDLLFVYKSPIRRRPHLGMWLHVNGRSSVIGVFVSSFTDRCFYDGSRKSRLTVKFPHPTIQLKLNVELRVWRSPVQLSIWFQILLSLAVIRNWLYLLLCKTRLVYPRLYKLLIVFCQVCAFPCTHCTSYPYQGGSIRTEFNILHARHQQSKQRTPESPSRAGCSLPELCYRTKEAICRILPGSSRMEGRVRFAGQQKNAQASWCSTFSK